jgi:hypothetical protein
MKVKKAVVLRAVRFEVENIAKKKFKMPTLI